ncbi:MAG: GTPase Era [Deltaproteobacteria bacterium RBG_16_49_23]|nr:MAG: GTPase Era [Deltaproteobacteria bacterium RBG_16_49_23]
MASFKSGYISILGRPNVGKSTLFNRIIGEKIAIVTERPQTTRNRILGIKNVEGGQLIFLDTPGIHEGRSELNRRMVQTAIASSGEADILLLLVEAFSPLVEEDRRMVELIKGSKGLPFLVINKIDLVRKERLLPLMDQYQRLHPFEKIIPVSAGTGEGVDILLEEILKALPESPPYYPEEIFTDQTERSIVSEIIREKVIHQTYQEVPHSSAVTIESFKEHPEKNLVVIQGTIHVEKDSQKKILIGKGGQRLKKIGETARKEIEAFLGKKVFLELWVKVERDWTRDPRALDELGYSPR